MRLQRSYSKTRRSTGAAQESGRGCRYYRSGFRLFDRLASVSNSGRAGKNTAVLDSVTAPLRKYLDDPSVTELVINLPQEVGIERHGCWTWENEPSLDFKNLDGAGYCRRRVHEPRRYPRKPHRLDHLPTGERVQIVVPPVVPDETVSITVRKPSSVTMTPPDFEAAGLFRDTRIAEKRSARKNWNCSQCCAPAAMSNSSTAQ